MPSPNILAALGAALQTGGKTLGYLNEQEQEQKRREAEFKFRQEQAAMDQGNRDRAFQLDQQQFDAAEKDRRFRILQAAIEGTAPNQVVNPELVDRSKEFGLDSQFTKTEAGSFTPAMPGMGMGMGLAMPILKESYSRTPKLGETAALDAIASKRDAQDNASAFRNWMATEGANADFDTRAAKALSLGQEAPPLSEKDRIAREDRDWKRRQKELNIMYPADRFGPDRGIGGSGAKGPAQQWLTAYDRIEDNTRQKYGAELAAFAKAAAEGQEGAPERLAELQQRIGAEATAMMEQAFGPMPTSPNAPAAPDKTQEYITDIDEAVKDFGGDWLAFKKAALANQAKLRKEGVDVPAYVAAIRSRIARRPTDVGGPPPPPNVPQEVVMEGNAPSPIDISAFIRSLPKLAATPPRRGATGKY